MIAFVLDYTLVRGNIQRHIIRHIEINVIAIFEKQPHVRIEVDEEKCEIVRWTIIENVRQTHRRHHQKWGECKRLFCSITIIVSILDYVSP